MSSSEESGTTSPSTCQSHQEDNKKNTKLRGIRRRKWGKWVSEIRVPGTQDRLWLGSYSTPEAAAVAHDIASYCLRGASSLEKLNFPLLLPAGVREDLSPRSIQLVASDAGMAVDAQLKINNHDSSRSSQSGHVSTVAAGESNNEGRGGDRWEGHDRSFSSGNGECLSISIDDYL